jgi:hypothetical protein
VHVDRFGEHASLVSGAGGHLVAGAIGARVPAGVVKRAVHAQEGEHAVAVALGEVLVERARVHAFGEQLADVAPRVVDDLTLDYGFAVVGGVVLQKAGAAGVDFRSGTRRRACGSSRGWWVDGGQAGGAEILVMAGVPGARLRRAVGEGDGVARAHCPVASAGARAGFEQGAVIA